MRMKKLILLLTALLLCGSPACLAASPQQEIWGYEQEIRKIADPLTENIMLMLNAESYGGFSADFDAKMKAAITESAFKALGADIKEKYGDYAAKDFINIELQGGYVIINYKGYFFKTSEPMLIRVVLQQEKGETKVGGFWINKLK